MLALGLAKLLQQFLSKLARCQSTNRAGSGSEPLRRRLPRGDAPPVGSETAGSPPACPPGCHALPGADPPETNQGDALERRNTRPGCSKGSSEAAPLVSADRHERGSGACSRKRFSSNHSRCRPPKAPCSVRSARDQKAYAYG